MDLVGKPYAFFQQKPKKHLCPLGKQRDATCSGLWAMPQRQNSRPGDSRLAVLDLKGELWPLTAGWRQKHGKNKVLRFEPASADSGVVRWNPLDEIRFDEASGFNIGDVQNLATLIVDPDGKGLESHWQKTAFVLLVGVILHALYLRKENPKKEAHLAAIDLMLSNPERDPAALWQEMIDNRHNNGLRNDIVASAGQDMKSRPKEEAGSVLSAAKSCLPRGCTKHQRITVSHPRFDAPRKSGEPVYRHPALPQSQAASSGAHSGQ